MGHILTAGDIGVSLKEKQHLLPLTNTARTFITIANIR